ncbi:MAG: alkaline phosphatase family protein [Fibrobacterales bacterium]
MKGITLHFIIDGLGWDIASECSTFSFLNTHYHELETVLGFSSSAIPSILTGKMPDEHGQGNLFYKSKKSSFPFFKLYPLLPRYLRSDNIPSKILKKGGLLCNKAITGFEGYYQAYDYPVDQLATIAICETKNIFAPHGVSGSKTIIDTYTESNTNWKCYSYKQGPDTQLLKNLIADCTQSSVEHCLIYLCEYDAFGHSHATNRSLMIEKANEYGRALHRIYTKLSEHYSSVQVTVCSDHGMVPLQKTVDIQALLNANNLLRPKDYDVILDSSMARFYVTEKGVESEIMKALAHTPGRFLTKEEIEYYHIDFNGKYGNLYFLLDSGVQISPSHMGRKPCNGMHGYDPVDPQMKAVFMSNYPITDPPKSICDMHSVYKKTLEATTPVHFPKKIYAPLGFPPQTHPIT